MAFVFGIVAMFGRLKGSFVSLFNLCYKKAFTFASLMHQSFLDLKPFAMNEAYGPYLHYELSFLFIFPKTIINLCSVWV